MSDILGAKLGDHKALFDEVERRFRQGQGEQLEYKTEDGVERRYRWVSGVEPNKTNPDVIVNFLEHREIQEGQERRWSWVTDLELNEETVDTVMIASRTRWKVENETFNTLKNQGYGLEHNYGHGKQHLATVFAVLMMLAFLIDQTQEHCCRLFQQARSRFHSRMALWERLRSYFNDFRISDWETLWHALAVKHVGPALKIDTS